MSDFNATDFTNPSTFILLGIPGLEAVHVWIAIPFSAIYAIAVFGNLAILFVVKKEPSLHEPMYYFLCMLAASDLVLSTSTLPKMLSIFWFNSREIHFSACLTQVFFIHCFASIASGILAAMAFDRYVAICHPLRHSTILTNPLVAKIGLAMLLRNAVVILPYPFLLRQWPYCRTNIIPEPYCVHIAVVKLACADTRVNSYYGLFVLFGVVGVDGIFIVISYMQILRAIFSLPSKDARLKTFLTCGTHLCAIVIFYLPIVMYSLIYRFGQNFPQHFHVLLGNMHFLLPTMLNPIIYGVKTKQIQGRLLILITSAGTVAITEESVRLKKVRETEWIHSTILTNFVVAKIGLAVLLRSGIVILPYPFLLRRWSYCRTNIIPEPYCSHIAVVKLACGDSSVSSYYGLFVMLCVVGLDVISIAISYMLILRAIFILPTKDARLKTFLTCGTHLCAIVIFYIPSVIYSLMSRFGKNFPLHVHVLLGNMHFLLPPMLNPIIYGVKTKQIRGRLLGLITHK
ncbi:olfactory receptor 52M1-like [Pelodiscus sinensis]|uniref:olfactory receptor 52M1-like n=1 Tax=Pelodiscus sinensis TaxID=13735 RepID=UPI003F6C9720